MTIPLIGAILGGVTDLIGDMHTSLGHAPDQPGIDSPEQ